MQCQQQHWKLDKCLTYNLLVCIESSNKLGLYSSQVVLTDPDPVRGVAMLCPVLGELCC